MPTSVVLDSFALLAFLEQEPGHQIVGDFLSQAAEGELRLGATAVNMGEVWYRYARIHSDLKADRAVADLRALGLEVVDMDWPLTRQAAAHKKSGGLSFADCYAAALAKAWNAALVTGDPEFKRLEKEVEIRWLRKK